MAEYRLTPKARDGLRGILEYVVGKFGERVAHKVLDRLEGAFEQIAESPGIGHQREDITTNEEVRFWSVNPSLIAYRALPDHVEVLFVERGERDWNELLKDFKGDGDS